MGINMWILYVIVIGASGKDLGMSLTKFNNIDNCIIAGKNIREDIQNASNIRAVYSCVQVKK